MARKSKSMSGIDNKGDMFQSAFPTQKPEEIPPVVEEDNHEDDPIIEDTQTEEVEEIATQTNEGENYLDELLTKKPRDIKRNFELHEHINRRLEKATKKYKHGFLKKFINAAIEKELNWLDEQESQRKKQKT